MYLPEIIQTSVLGRLQKKSLGHNDCLYVASVSQRTVAFKQIVKVLKALEQHWEKLSERNFADLGHVFAHWDN